jgi:hypothetical protein
VDSALFARSLEKGFDAQGASAELNPGVSPVHVITQESEHPEYRYLRQERLAGAHSADGADAANLSNVGVRNPANSGALVIVTDIFILNEAAAARNFFVKIGSTPTVDAEGLGFFRDTRYGPTATARATGRVFIRTAAAFGNGLFPYRLVQDTSIWLRVNFVLPPDAFVVVAGANNNEQVRAGFCWIERSMESGELQGSGV